MKRILILIFSLSALISNAQTITVNGYVSDSATGEKLIGATIYDVNKQEGTVTNTYGFYSLTMKANTANLIISYVGYKNYTLQINGEGAHSSNVNLVARASLNTVKIVAEKNPIQEQSQMSTISIPIEQIKKVPMLMGETDVLKVLQLLPGVSKGSEGSSGIYVRGGSPDQNLILLDGVPVYNVNHMAGFFSVFNGDAISNVQLVKGGFPARYGGRLSSVIDIKMKEGNTKKIHGEGGVGIISSRLTLEGPIKKNENTTFLISARRTYIDVLTRPLIYLISGGEASGGYYFYDLNAKINHKFSDKDHLYLSTYMGNDILGASGYNNSDNTKSETSFKLKWGNITTALRWNHLLSPKMFVNTTATFSKYKFLVGATEKGYINNNLNNSFGIEYKSGITDAGFKTDFDYSPVSKHHIKMGSNYTYHIFTPGVVGFKSTSSGTTNIDTSLGSNRTYTHEAYLYAEDDWEISNKLKANAGLHLSGFYVQKTFYNSLQPRLSLRYLIDEKMSIKASYSNMTQYLHLLSNAGIGLPTDLWLPVTAKIKPQQCRQAAIGIARTLNNEYEVCIEGYYKDITNLIE